MNILSMQCGTHITGKEINSWCIEQIHNHTSHQNEARRIIRKNYSDCAMYEAIRITPHEKEPTKIGFKRLLDN